MQASETRLQQLIEGTKQYLIPLFQRAYSWKKSEWQVLWDDLVELCTTDNSRPHFMGSIVTVPTTSVPEGVGKYLLIDGQQRLTTIFILLCALRDRARQGEESRLSEEIQNKYLVNVYEEGLDFYKLQPTQVDRVAFHQIIEAEAEIDGSVISECYRFFEARIRQSRLELQKIKKVICSSFSLVSVVLSADDDPYLVFESLNAKGRPLTQADLIRNYFFMRIHRDAQESAYAKYWQPMQALLGDNLTDFIRHYLTKSGIEVKQSEIYYEIKEKINKSDAISYLKDVGKFAEYYARFLHPERENNIKIRKYLHRLKRLEVATVYPFILNCYDNWMQARITEEEFISVLQILENFILRRFVCNVQTRGLNRIFALLYSQVIKDTDLTSGTFVGRLKLALQTRDYPQDPEFKARLMEVKLYGSNRSEKAKLILESLEESVKHKEQVAFDKLTIEHLMPQTLNNWWQEHLGEDWTITHELLIHSLGNLTLTAYNSELSNDNFFVKQAELKNSHLELNKYFHDKMSWRRNDIETRAEYLADRALQVWKYFGDNSAKLSQSSQIKGSIPKSVCIFGDEQSVKSWRDVLEITLNRIADLEPERFQDIMAQFPRFVGWDEKDFRSTRQLQNGAFMEVNLSAKDIHTFCLKALETAELSIGDWQVETAKTN